MVQLPEDGVERVPVFSDPSSGKGNRKTTDVLLVGTPDYKNVDFQTMAFGTGAGTRRSKSLVPPVRPDVILKI